MKDIMLNEFDYENTNESQVFLRMENEKSKWIEWFRNDYFHGEIINYCLV
jgi:hypothetical protein